MENLKNYLIQVKRKLESGEQVLMTEPINEVIKRLEEGEKYKKILDDIEKAISPGGIIEYDFNYENYLRDNAPDETYIKFMHDCIKKIKQKYFPEPVKKTITINIETTNERELFRQLIKAKYLLEKYFEDGRRRNIQPIFSNFDICSEKVQVIIKDKEVIK